MAYVCTASTMLAAFPATAAWSQEWAPVGAHSSSAVARHAAAFASAEVDDGTFRTVLAGAGMLAGAYVGARYASDHSHSASEFGNVDRELLGAVIGSVLGSATLASLPQLHSDCNVGIRWGRSLLASTAGAVVSGLPGLATRNVPVMLFGHVLGAVVGSVMGAESCGSS